MKQRNIGLTLSYVNICLTTVIGLFMSSFVLRKLGSDEYGVYQIMSSFATYLGLLQFGTGTVMTRNIAKLRGEKKSKHEIDESISTVFTISLVLSAIIIFVATVFYCYIGKIYAGSLNAEQIIRGKQLFIIITIGLVSNFMMQGFSGILFGYEEFSFVKITGIVKLVVRTAVIVGLFMFIPKSMTLVTVDMLFDVIILFMTVVHCRKRYKVKLSPRLFSKDVFGFSMPLAFALFFQTIVNQANNNVDKFVIGVVLTPASVSVYSVAMFIFMTYSSISTIPISIYLPTVVKSIGAGLRGREITDTLIEPCRLVTLIGGVIIFGFIAVGQQFINVVYGNEFRQAYIIALMIMLPMFINMSNGVLINILDALGKRMYRSIVLAGIAAGNIALTIWWIHIWGIVGAAAATTVCTFIGQIGIMNLYYSKRIGIPVMYLFRETYRGILPVMILCSAVAFAIARLDFMSEIVQMFVGGAVFVVILITLLWFFGLNSYEKGLISSYWKK